MPTYKEFAEKARTRFLERQQHKKEHLGQYIFTSHAQHKMRQYALSEQKVRHVIRYPKRTQTGVAPRTIAVMQPISPKNIAGKEVWKQEVWVMFQKQPIQKKQQKTPPIVSATQHLLVSHSALKVISAWRYPGMSPKNHPIPDEILRELTEGSIVERDDTIF
ncbi:MAG: hypothetical protein ACSLEX_00120 [Minisyncoccota bacterium]